MHWDDPDCPPPGWERNMQKRPRAPRSASIKAVRYLRKRYADAAGDMQPLEKVCDIMDAQQTRSRVRLQAAQTAWEMAHGKLAPAPAPASAVTVEVTQQAMQANVQEAPRGQLTTGDRARQLAGLLKATAVLGDVCESHASGGAGPAAGEPAAGGADAPAGGAGGSGGPGA